MRYGHFDDKRREYVIENPDTPKSWVNYLGTDEYCGIISNNAAGYGFHTFNIATYLRAQPSEMARWRCTSVIPRR